MSQTVPESPRDSMGEGAPLVDCPLKGDEEETFPLPEKKSKPWILLCVLVFFLIAIVDVGAFLAEPPKTRVYEARLCFDYYQEHDPSKIGHDGAVPEELCKEDAIQQQMAMIFGWQDLFDAIPGILLAVPFGTLADKHGRKWVFAAALGGLQLNSAWILLICYFRSLPLQFTWFSSAFFVVGGGPIVAGAVGITMVSDIVPPDKRTSIFLYLTAGVLISEMIAPMLAATLMEKGNWLPLLLALAIQQVGMCIVFVLPETLHLRDLPEPKDSDSEENIELQPVCGERAFAVKTQLRNFKDALTFLRRDANLALVILSFMGSRVGRQGLAMLIRYASKRYKWKISKAAYLQSFRAATNLVALIVLLPLLNLMLLRCFQFPPHWADLWIARGSIILITISFLVMGIAAYPALLILGLLIFNLGTGFHAAMRSVSIHVVGGQSSPEVGRLFAVIAIMESIGTMVAGPALAQLFEWGIAVGEPWIGAPYIVSAGVFALVTVITFIVSVKDKNSDFSYTAVGSDDAEVDIESFARRHQD